MRKLTKIIATISDDNCEVEFIRGLYERGMDVARLNTAHQTPEDTLRVVQNIRQVSDKIPMMIDTKGPEVRTTKTEEEIWVEKGDIVRVKGAPDQLSTREMVCLSYAGIANDVNPGNDLLIDDGELKLSIIDKDGDILVCEVQNPGRIKGKKSVNVPNVHINLPALSNKDLCYIRFAAQYDIDFIAHSFVRSKEDILEIKRILEETNSKVKIIAKIENQEGVDNIDEILDHAYGVMVARGDLGIELPAEKIPIVQRLLVRKCIKRKRPVIIATQMLHSMIENPRPTRAEVSDVANAIFMNTDAIMLSGETTYGKYAFEAVETMTKIALEVEANKRESLDVPDVSVDNVIGVYLASTAVDACKRLNIRAILLDTQSGRTARYVAAYRGSKTVYAICYNQRPMRELALSYGVYADYFAPQQSTTEEFRRKAISTLYDKGVFEDKDYVCVIGGSSGPRHGATFMEIDSVHNFIAGERKGIEHID